MYTASYIESNRWYAAKSQKKESNIWRQHQVEPYTDTTNWRSHNEPSTMPN